VYVCHSQIWTNAEMLEASAEPATARASRPWIRVPELPEFAYFNHSIHVAKGVGCETCHGRVDQMALTYKVNSLYMEWCLECHRQPEKYLRPREEVYTHGLAAGARPTVLEPRTVRRITSVDQLTNCLRYVILK
jgi:hypothetical protein